MWHPGTTTCLTLAQSLNQLFSKNFQPPWEAALPDCDTQQQRDWFAQKRREIDLIEQEMEIRRMEIKLQEQQFKEQQMRERLQDGLTLSLDFPLLEAEKLQLRSLWMLSTESGSLLLA